MKSLQTRQDVTDMVAFCFVEVEVMSSYSESMKDTELLILHGPPGSDKTSVAQIMSELLCQKNVTNAIIDLDYRRFIRTST